MSAAEEILVARELQGSVEDDVRAKMATATGQLLEAQGRLAEWQAEDEREAQEARDAAEAQRRKEEDERRQEAAALEERRAEEARKAAEVRDTRRRDALAAEERRQAAQKPKIVAGSGTVGGGSGSTAAEEVGTKNAEDVIDITSDAEDDSTPVPRPHGRRTSAIRAGKRKAIESDAGEPETTPRAKRLRRRAGNAEDAKEKTPPPPAPLDVTEYGEYDPAGKTIWQVTERVLMASLDASSSPNNVEWGCGFGASKESCPHPLVEFTDVRQCFRCQQGQYACVGTGCHACGTCTGSKVKCSHAKTRSKLGKTTETGASGSKTTGEKGKQRATAGPRSRSRRGREAGESSRTTRAASGNTAMPVLVAACADHELRTLAQVMSSMDARIAALKQATEEAESTRAAATRSLTALILRRELEDAERAEAADEEEREADRREREDADFDGE